MQRYAEFGLILITLGLGFCLLSAPAVEAQAPARPTTWEYQAVLNQGGEGVDVSAINSYGNRGWELVNTWTSPNNKNSYFILKRAR